MINKYFALSLVAASVAVASGCSSDDDDDDTAGPDPVYVSPPATPGVGGSVYDYIVGANESGEFLTLKTAIDAAGLADTLDDETFEFTVFAPDDAAFAALDAETEGTVDALLADTDRLAEILRYHVVEGTQTAEDIGALVAAGPVDVETLLEGESVSLSLGNEGQGLAVNGVALVGTDLQPEVADGETAVGVVHQITEVLDAPEVDDSTTGGETDGGETDGGTTDGGTTDGGTTDGGTTDGGSTGGGETGPVASSLAANNSVFLSAFSERFGAQKLDAATDVDPWTVFAPTEATADIDVGNYIITGSGLTPQQLIDMGSSPSFGGTTLTFGGTPDALTVNDLPATLVGGEATITYSVEGAL